VIKIRKNKLTSIFFVFISKLFVPKFDLVHIISDPDSCHSIFISVFNQLDAQNLFHNKFYFMPINVSSTCAHHQEVKIALHRIWYHHTYRCDDTRGCAILTS